MASHLRLYLLGSPTMTRVSAITVLQVCAGLIAAPLAWMVSVQLGQILPYIDCNNRIYSTAISAAVATAVALSAAGLSLRRGVRNEGRPGGFVGSGPGV